MKYFIYNCFLIIIILFFAYINTQQDVDEEKEKEAFTPKIRGLYRPYLRNARIISEGLYNNHSANISNLFRKVGIM
jgi:hypothetical protein